MAFCSLKYSYVGKDNIRGKAMQIWIRKTGFLLESLRSCDLRTGAPNKICGFAIRRLIITNLLFGNLLISEICGLALAASAQEFAVLRFAD
jgi:hypothetical protein